MIDRKLFSSESVSPGHPDKVADQISDAILDAIIAENKQAHVACEVLVKNNTVILAGEIRSKARIVMEEIVKEVIADIGYHNEDESPMSSSTPVINMLTDQSDDIAQGIDRKHKKEARRFSDQGLMFGYYR